MSAYFQVWAEVYEDVQVEQAVMDQWDQESDSNNGWLLLSWTTG